MVRPLRYNAAGVSFHVMARGNNREPIFLQDDDYRYYLGSLALAVARFSVELHAYCLMRNHLHLLVSTHHPNLSWFMHHLQGGYAQWFNCKYSRIGHVFQARYRSKVVGNDSYLLEVGRYIHLNPVYVRLVRHPEEYAWGSLQAYIHGSKKVPISKSLLLSAYSGRDQLRRFLEFTTAKGTGRHSNGDWPKEDVWYAKPDEKQTLIRPQGQDSKETSENHVLSEVAEVFQSDVTDILQGWRRPASGGARAAAAWALRDQAHMSLRCIASFLGFQTPQGVCSAIARLRVRLSKDKDLRSRIIALSLLNPVPSTR